MINFRFDRIRLELSKNLTHTNACTSLLLFKENKQLLIKKKKNECLFKQNNNNNNKKLVSLVNKKLL